MRYRLGTPFDVRSSGHDITKVEWIVELPSSNKSTRVGNVSHEECTMLISGCSKFTVIPVPRVRRSAANDQFGFEETGLRSQRVVVDQIRFTVDTVRKGLEIYGRSCHLLLSGLEKKLGKISVAMNVNGTPHVRLT